MEIVDFVGSVADQNELKIRCPQCYQNFDVMLSDIKNLIPKFECTSCQSKFKLSLKDKVDLDEVHLGELLSNENYFIANRIFESEDMHKLSAKCPKCSHAYAKFDKECPSCGVVFSALQKLEQQKNLQSKSVQLYASSEVKHVWEEALLDYDNLDAHQNFVAAAWADGSLDYASAKYSEMLELMPGDKTALRLLNELKALAGVQFENTMSNDLILPEKSSDIFLYLKEKILSFRSLNLSFKRMRLANVITNLILIGCGVVIAMGILLPHLRNLIGFGVSLLFLVLALRFFVRVI